MSSVRTKSFIYIDKEFIYILLVVLKQVFAAIGLWQQERVTVPYTEHMI